MSKAPPPSRGDFLTGEEILALGKDRLDSLVTDAPDVDKVPCTYCGELTRQHGYTNTTTSTHWPACCSRPKCLDRWDSSKVSSV